ncbi:H-NS family nucleoid-associated regulatory protein [Paraburkholderia sp.]|uniref:H-NS histone family protein n=1 Tax=Paraburkholderia sp. TaxID=1926495 RepID=UPI0025F3BC16|nr:H-NS family nucleoid-associated regulatory protein [Paraburkholderia sp.]
MITLDAIQLKIAKLQKQAAAIAEKQTSIGLERIRDLMHKHGLSLADIESFVGKKRGRKPSVKVGNGMTKSAGKKMQTVAPKYADPKSGATWSGRGRAPAWIRDVKDRTRFLIDGNEGKKAAGTKAAVGKKAPVKRQAAKKVARKAVAAKRGSVQRRAASVTGATARKKAAPAKKRAAPRKTAAKRNVAVAAKMETPAVVAE